METKSIATFSITHPVTDPTTRLIEEAPQEDTADKKEESSIPIVGFRHLCSRRSYGRCRNRQYFRHGGNIHRQCPYSNCRH